MGVTPTIRVLPDVPGAQRAAAEEFTARTEAARHSAAAARGGYAPVDSARYLPATLVGRSARHALAADRAWRVFAVFRRSFYCRSASGALILVGPATLGAGPLHVLWAGSGELERRLPAVGMGVGVDLDGAGPDASAALTLGLRDAREWRPPAPPCWNPTSLRRGLAWLAYAAERAPAEGVGQLIAPLAAGAADPARLVGAPSLARRAWPALAALSGWIRDALVRGRAAGTLPASVDGLVGLGPGLTPSGDDVLAGALLALHAFARPDLAGRLAAWLRPRAEGRTGAISLAHLECAAHGEGAAVLHDALAALSSGDPVTLAGSTAAVGTLGHSSGWDGLAGIVAVGAAWLGAVADDGRPSTPCR